MDLLWAAQLAANWGELPFDWLVSLKVGSMESLSAAEMDKVLVALSVYYPVEETAD